MSTQMSISTGQLLLDDLCPINKNDTSHNFLVDPLAQSVAMYQNRKNGNKSQILSEGLTPIRETTAEKLITDDDHEIAGQIRDYYSKKIMMWRLTEFSLSPYREDLSTFIHLNDFSEVSDRMIPLIYKLPEFYFEDIKIENVFYKCKKIDEDVIAQTKGIKELTYLTSTTKTTKLKLKFTEYWFHDENKYPVLIKVQQNPLTQLWEKIIQDHSEENKPVIIDASTYSLMKFRGETNVIIPKAYHLV